MARIISDQRGTNQARRGRDMKPNVKGNSSNNPVMVRHLPPVNSIIRTNPVVNIPAPDIATKNLKAMRAPTLGEKAEAMPKTMLMMLPRMIVRFLPTISDRFIILDRTNFYAESGGQSGDVGTLTNDDVGVCFQVEDTQKRKGQVVHRGRLIRGTLEPGMKVIAMPDEEGRAACSANHTATHLLNSALHRVLAVTGQRGSSVTRNGFCFDFVSLEGALPPTKVIEIEDWVNRIIQDGYQIETKTIPFDDALSHSDLILLPGEPYPPRNSRMVIVSSASSNESDVPFSRELCGGTHVENTRDIQRFVITAHHGVKMGVRSIRGVTRAKAFECEEVGKVMVEQLEEILQVCRSTKDLSKKEVEQLDKRVQGLKAKMYLKCYPFRLESDISTQAEEAERTLRSKKRVDVLETIQEDIASVLARPEVECLPYFVYGIAIPTNVFLSKVTRDCPPDKPVCVVGATVRGEIVARTSVPKSLKPVASEEERRRICDEVKRAAIRVAESGMFGRDHASKWWVVPQVMTGLLARCPFLLLRRLGGNGVSSSLPAAVCHSCLWSQHRHIRKFPRPKPPPSFSLTEESLEGVSVIVQEAEPNYLRELIPKAPVYPPLNLQLRGYDFAVLENYQSYIQRLLKFAGVHVVKSWAIPATTCVASALDPITGQPTTSYDLILYQRDLNMINVTGAQAAIVVDLVAACLPPGVKAVLQPHTPQDEENRYIPDLELRALQDELDELGGPVDPETRRLLLKGR
ncbi:unnamed protein product [Cyprideis torosa]|uniref:alanine--tRNA ligase n=1 Tax=Cyprideis torosa TaxID=163714 RepID=A0A7R8ZK53_9CRUS|nr:unnamed protein product [Cyprideis torosa]CAG0890030.1 unnamed protein product [Cyprideis torosa]